MQFLDLEAEEASTSEEDSPLPLPPPPAPPRPPPPPIVAKSDDDDDDDDEEVCDDHCKYCAEQVLEANGFDYNEIQAAQAYCKNACDEEGHFNLEKFREAYRGYFDSDGEFCREIGELDQIPSEPAWLAHCIDWGKAWDYAFQYDFSEFDGHYFWSGWEVIDPESESDEVCSLSRFFHFDFTFCLYFHSVLICSNCVVLCHADTKEGIDEEAVQLDALPLETAAEESGDEDQCSRCHKPFRQASHGQWGYCHGYGHCSDCWGEHQDYCTRPDCPFLVSLSLSLFHFSFFIFILILF